MWQCLPHIPGCYYSIFYSISVIKKLLTKIVYKQQSKLPSSTSVTGLIGNKLNNEKCQQFNTDKTFNQQNICPRKHLPGENILSCSGLGKFNILVLSSYYANLHRLIHIVFPYIFCHIWHRFLIFLLLTIMIIIAIFILELKTSNNLQQFKYKYDIK